MHMLLDAPNVIFLLTVSMDVIIALHPQTFESVHVASELIQVSYNRILDLDL